jgi:hypothetical protein
MSLFSITTSPTLSILAEMKASDHVTGIPYRDRARAYDPSHTKPLVLIERIKLREQALTCLLMPINAAMLRASILPGGEGSRRDVP